MDCQEISGGDMFMFLLGLGGFVIAFAYSRKLWLSAERKGE